MFFLGDCARLCRAKRNRDGLGGEIYREEIGALWDWKLGLFSVFFKEYTCSLTCLLINGCSLSQEEKALILFGSTLSQTDPVNRKHNTPNPYYGGQHNWHCGWNRFHGECNIGSEGTIKIKEKKIIAHGSQFTLLTILMNLEKSLRVSILTEIPLSW